MRDITVKGRLAGLCALGLTLLVPASASAAVQVGLSGWSWGNPTPQGNDLRSIDFAGGRGYAVGAFGTALRTDDGGQTWQGLATGTTAALSRLQLIDPDTVVVNAGCTLRRSDDGGRTFPRLGVAANETDCDPGEQVSAFFFAGKQIGYAILANGTVFRTDDAGRTIAQRTAVPGTPQAPGGGGAVPNDVVFTTSQNGFVVTGPVQGGPGALFRTQDGANTWQQIPVDAGRLRSIVFVDATTGYAVGDSTILRTTDGGQTWTRQPSGQNLGLSQIRCAGATTCLISTVGGTQLLRTTDGGQTADSLTPSTRPVYAAAFGSPALAVAVGAGGTTVRSGDAGNTFQPVGTDIGGVFSRLRVVSTTVAYASGANGRVARTVNGGQSFDLLGAPTSRPVVDVAFPSQQVGFVLDEGGSVRRTDNGGVSFSAPLDTGLDVSPRAIVAVDQNRLLLIGPRGVSRSADGGRSFGRPGRPVSQAALSDYDRAGSALAIFGSRALLITSDAGKTFRSVPLPSGKTTIRDVDFTSSKAGLVLDTAGRVFTTRTAGKKWSELTAIGTDAGTRLSFGTLTQGFVAVSSFGGIETLGYALRTSDGGRSWRPQLIDSTPLKSIESANGLAAFGLTGERSLFFTNGGGDRGTRSTLTVTTKTTKLTKASLSKAKGQITLTVRLAGAVGGERVVLSQRTATGGPWTDQTLTLSPSGTKTVRAKLSRSSLFVAQWRGDSGRQGDGSSVLSVLVR